MFYSGVGRFGARGTSHFQDTTFAKSLRDRQHGGGTIITFNGGVDSVAGNPVLFYPYVYTIDAPRLALC